MASSASKPFLGMANGRDMDEEREEEEARGGPAASSGELTVHEPRHPTVGHVTRSPSQHPVRPSATCSHAISIASVRNSACCTRRTHASRPRPAVPRDAGRSAPAPTPRCAMLPSPRHRQEAQRSASPAFGAKAACRAGPAPPPRFAAANAERVSPLLPWRSGELWRVVSAARPEAAAQGAVGGVDSAGDDDDSCRFCFGEADTDDGGELLEPCACSGSQVRCGCEGALPPPTR